MQRISPKSIIIQWIAKCQDVFHSNLFFSGITAILVLSAKLFVTTAPAPTITLSPNSTPGKITAFEPIQQFFPIKLWFPIFNLSKESMLTENELKSLLKKTQILIYNNVRMIFVQAFLPYNFSVVIIVIILNFFHCFAQRFNII